MTKGTGGMGNGGKDPYLMSIEMLERGDVGMVDEVIGVYA
jgi:hypothetical protein